MTGKPVGSDLAEGKVTLPLIAALRQATEADGRRIRRLASRRKWTPTQWRTLMGLMERAGGFDAARARAHELADEARHIAARELRPEPGARAAQRTYEALDRAIDYAVRRDS